MLPEILEHAADRYAELERRIDRLMPARCAGVCLDCRGGCCRAGMANQTIRTWWLREVSVRAHGRWWPDDWRQRAGCVALTERGCLLSAGRPVNCRTYFCEPYLAACRDVWQTILCAFLSELLPETMRLSPKLNLLDLSAEEGVSRAGEIAECVEASHRLLAAAEQLADEGAPERTKHRVALELLCSMPGMLRPAVRRRVLAEIGGVPGGAAAEAGGEHGRS